MRKQKPIHGAGPPGKPLLPLEAEVEILEKLGADLRIGSGEIAAILKKHGVEADVERLQDSYRKRLGQRLMASIRDEEGCREVLARGSEYIVVECCSDQQALKAIRHRIHIAKDEQARLLRLGGGQKISLLEKYDFTEQDAKELCQTAGLLSPVYEFTDRGGCWFCPNAKRKELRHLYDHHPDLWNRMLELQAIPGKVSEKFDRKRRFSDIDALFRQEDACNEAAGKAA